MNISAAEFAILEAKQAAKVRGKSDPEPQKAGQGVQRESDLHDAVSTELMRRRIYFVHSRMDRPATNGIGTPDYIIAMPGGKTLWLELKSRTGKLTAEQQTAKHLLESAGHKHAVVRSMAEFLAVIDEVLGRTRE